MYVYVIGGARRHIKIGISNNPKNRLKQVQTGCPFTLHIKGTWRTDRAREIERRSHLVLAKYRWAGEWFDVPSQVGVLAVSMLVAASPSRSEAKDRPMKKAILFCRGCQHTGVTPFIPDIDARFRCSKCNSRDHVHVVDFIANLLSD